MFKNKLFAVVIAAITFCSAAATAYAYPWDYGTTDEESSYGDPYATGEDPSYPVTTETPPVTSEQPPNTSDTSDTSEPPPPPPPPPVTSDTSDTSEPPDTSDTSDTSEPPPPPPPAPVIRLNFYSASLVVGEGAQLNANFENSTWDNSIIRYTSFNTDVAIVDDRGYIMAVGEGSAYITAYYSDIQASALISVTKPAEVPEYLVIKQDKFELKIGETAQIDAQLLPADVSEGYSISYESDDPDIAAVNEKGLISALKTGTTDITVSGAGLTETVSVTVTSDIAYDTAKMDGYLYNNEGNPVVGVQIIIDSLKAITDTRGYFSFESVDQRELTLKIADDKKAVCKITPHGDMTVYLLYKKGSPLTRLSSYEELVGRLPINKVTFVSGTNVILTPGETFELVYQYTPKDVTVTEITYTASNEIVANVGQIDGVITAKAPGETDITISLNGGQAEAVCHVVVNPGESTEHSVLIAVIETAVIAAAALVFLIAYRSYRKKLVGTLDKYDEEDNIGGDE